MIIRWRQTLRRWIPGIITGGADNDPAGIATYSISGAQFGYQQLWLLILSTPMLIAVQAMCARLGDVKRKGLMTIIREHYSPAFMFAAAAILVIANTATIGADLAAMADVTGLVTNTSYIFWIAPVAIILWYIIVFENYKIIEKFLFFLTFIFLSYIVSGILAKPDWQKVIHDIFLPNISLTPGYLVAGLGLMGTTVTPYLFFWQTKQEIEEHEKKIEMMKEAKKEDAILAPGFIYSNIISLFIIISTASVLHHNGVTNIITAGDAARALEPFAGSLAKYLFAVGIFGAGLLAIPVLAASTAYAIAESFGWRDSLSDKVAKARGFYTVLTLSILIGIAISLSGISPIRALFYSQVLDGILGPILIILILFLCNDKKVMGKFTNPFFDNLFGILAAAVMLFGSVSLFWQLIF